jgi:hypothetical protein
MLHLITIISFLSSLINLDVNNEQIAFNYFFETMYYKKYDSKKPFYFSGSTEQKGSEVGPFVDCYSENTSFKNGLIGLKKAESEYTPIEISVPKTLKTTKKVQSRGCNVRIFKSISIGEDDYVYIIVFRPRMTADHYLIRLREGAVVDFCETNEVI